MQIASCFVLILTSLVLLVVPSAPTLATLQGQPCQASWCSTPYVWPVPGTEACIQWTEFSYQAYSGGCAPNSIKCQIQIQATVKNNSTDDCECSHIWAYPSGETTEMGGDTTPQDFCGQNSTASFNVSMNVSCGATSCSGVPFDGNELQILVQCGNEDGPDHESSVIGRAYARLKCNDC